MSNFNLHIRPVGFVHNSEWIELNITLNGWFVPSSSNQPLYIKHCVFWVCCQLVFRSVTNKSFTLRSKCHIRWRDPIALVIGNYLHPAILKNSNTTNHKQYRLTDYTIYIFKHILTQQ